MSDVDHNPIRRRKRGVAALLSSRLLWLGGGGYAAVLVLLMLFENFLIYPAPRYPEGNWSPALPVVEDVDFESADGTRLHGWFVDRVAPTGYVLFCHGNGENVSHLADLLQLLSDEYDLAVFAFDYRGYGRSEGAPHEEGVLADARAARAWLQQRAKIPATEIILMGRSLGGAVAVDLAVDDAPRALILENTFTSLPDVAARLYRWAPVRWLMRSQFNSLQKIEQFHGPLLISHGSVDDLIPIAHARSLFAAAASTDKQFLEYPDDGHNDPRPRSYFDQVSEFVEGR